jgi:transposase-like protein
MEANIISTFKRCVVSIQLKLSDCFSGKSTFGDALTEQLSVSRKRNLNECNELILHAGNRFEIHNPRCPDCDSSDVIKQEFYPRNLKLAEFGQQTVYVRRYSCKKCNKKFTTSLNAIVEKGHQYPRLYQKQVQESYKTGYSSFRHLKRIFHSLYGNSPSHQSICNWVAETTSISDNSKYSGYYCYDEQYLRINGKRFYRLSFYDSILDKPVHEEIFDDIKYHTVYSFIKKAIAGKPLHAITTDHRLKYKTILTRLKVNHQLCIFHLFKMIGKEVYKKLKSKLVSYRDKIRMCILFTEIKEIFRTCNLNIAIYRLEKLLKHLDEFPKIFHKSIQKICQDFNRLTLSMRDGLVSRTTNPVEKYYRNTIPDHLKRLFKTTKGTLCYLNIKKYYWIENISKNI